MEGSATSRIPASDLIIVLMSEIGLVGALHFLGRFSPSVDFRSLGPWLADSNPVDAITALARLSGLVIGYWLLATTVMYVAAVRAGWSSVVNALRWITVPAIRHLAHGMAATSLASAAIVGPMSTHTVLAQSVPDVDSGPSLVFDLLDQPEAQTGSGFDPGPAGLDPPAGSIGSDFWLPPLTTPTDSPGTPAPEAQRSPINTTYRVNKGDSMWTIAKTHITQSVGPDVSDEEIGRYWWRVVEVNQKTIKSGDPNLIFPGEIISLPAIKS